jgi:hypothetical protein
MTIVDTNDNTSSHIHLLTSKGVTAVGRYYSSSAWKRITKPEANVLSAAGIQIFVVFENSGDPQLTAESGIHDAQIALQQATNLGQPQGSAIYFAMENLPHGYGASHVPGIKQYFNGLRQVLDNKYKIGVYSDGVVCAALLDDGLCDYAWLSASTSFPGSRDFDRSGRWALAQRRVDLNWSGLSIATNDGKGDFGAFQVQGAPFAPRAIAANGGFDGVAATTNRIFPMTGGFTPSKALADFWVRGVKALARENKQSVDAISEMEIQQEFAKTLTSVFGTLAQQLRYGGGRDCAITRSSRFVLPYQIELCERFFIIPDEAGTFLTMLRDELGTGVSAGARIQGAWGRIDLDDSGDLQYVLTPPSMASDPTFVPSEEVE